MLGPCRLQPGASIRCQPVGSLPRRGRERSLRISVSARWNYGRILRRAIRQRWQPAIEHRQEPEARNGRGVQPRAFGQGSCGTTAPRCFGFPAGRALRVWPCRELIDENRVSKGYLKRGQQKNLKTDHVVLRVGLPKEIEVIQRIFREYVETRKSEEGIVRRLNREGVPNHRGRPWTRRMIDYILRNENYIGNTVYNRESFPLRGRRIKNPPGLWIRTKGSITPAIDRSIFLRAQRRLTLRWQHLTDDELLLRLKALLEKEGRLSEKIVNTTLGVPAVNVYDERFGSLRNAYQRIGYNIKWDFDWIDRKNQFKKLLRDIADDISDRLKKAGAVACFEPGIDVLTVNDRFAISFRL